MERFSLEGDGWRGAGLTVLTALQHSGGGEAPHRAELIGSLDSLS